MIVKAKEGEWNKTFTHSRLYLIIHKCSRVLRIRTHANRTGDFYVLFTQKPCKKHSKRLFLRKEKVLGFVPRMFQGNSEKRGQNGLSQR